MHQLTTQQHRQLAQLNRRLTQILFATAPQRDPVTGVFKVGSAITGKSLRAAWGLDPRGDPNRNAFKSALLAALKTRPVSKP